MTIVLIIWNVLLTAGLAYVIGGYLWHINVTHDDPETLTEITRTHHGDTS